MGGDQGRGKKGEGGLTMRAMSRPSSASMATSMEGSPYPALCCASLSSPSFLMALATASWDMEMGLLRVPCRHL